MNRRRAIALLQDLALVLLTVTGVYALVLMLFKICLSRLM